MSRISREIPNSMGETLNKNTEMNDEPGNMGNMNIPFLAEAKHVDALVIRNEVSLPVRHTSIILWSFQKTAKTGIVTDHRHPGILAAISSLG